MNLLDLLTLLRQAKIQLTLDGEKLKIKAPKGAVTPEIKQHLTALKPEIIEFLKESQKPTEKASTIPLVDRDQPLVLSFTQVALWTMDKLNPGGIAYNLPMAFKFTGELNSEVLNQAIHGVLSRQESLRMVVAEGDTGEPYAVLQSVPDQVLGLHEIRIEDSAQADQMILESVRRYANQSFDLAKGPLYRFDLIQVVGEAQQQWVLAVCLHHIISDGLSQNLLAREIALHYASLLHASLPQQQPVALEPLSIQYLDYAAWQRQLFSGDKLTDEIEFWRKQLEDVPSLLALPTDRPRPIVQTTKGAKYRFAIPKRTSELVAKVCQGKGVTLFMGLMAGLQLVLSRHAQQTDFCLGMPTLGRNHKELEQLIGFFVNGILVRADLSGNPTWEQHLGRVQQRLLDVMAHQDTPAQLIIDNLEIPRNPSYPPLAQVGFQLQNFKGSVQSGAQENQLFDTFQKLTNLKMESLVLDEADSKFDMIITVAQNDDDLTGYVEYNTDLFNESTIARLVEHYVSALDSMADLHTRIDAVALESTETLHQHLGLEKGETLRRLTTTQMAFVQDLQLRPHTKQYAVGFIYNINAELDQSHLKHAINHVVQSHEALRCRYVRCDLPWADGAYQVVKPVVGMAANVTLDVIDIADQSDPDSFVYQHHERWCYVEADIFKDDLLRFQLLTHGDRCWLLLASHHIVIDGISGMNMLQKIVASYHALVAGEPLPQFEDHFPQYIDRHFQQVDSADSLGFWRQQAQAVAPLSYSLPKQRHQHNHYQILSQPVSAELLENIKRYCRSKKSHPSILFRLVAALLVKQYCRPEEDFVLWDIQSGRDKIEALDIGVFYQQTPYIIPLDCIGSQCHGDDFFAQQKQYRKAIRGNTFLSLQALNQLFPAGNLVFQYNYFNFLENVEMAGSSTLPYTFSSHVDNTVQVFIKDYGHELYFELWTDGTAFVDLHFLQRMESLTRQIVEQDSQFSQLNFLLENEQTELQQWNSKSPVDQVINFEPLTSLADGLYQAVASAPDAVAVYHGDLASQSELTYHELNARSNQLSRLLSEHGVGPQSSVGICMDRGPWFIVSIWAVIKTGAVYIPIESGYPKDRIAYILDDAKAKVLLTQECLLETVQGSCDSLLTTETLPQQLAAFSEDNVEYRPQPQDPLYIIYTSGSTGKPKGAVVTHAGELNLLQWYRGLCQFGSEARALVVSAFGFDLTQKNLLAPLLCGSAIVIPQMEQYDGDFVASVVQKYQVSHINCAPSTFYGLLDGDEQRKAQQLCSLRWVVLGGEALQLSRLQSWLQHSDTQAKVVNSYGPTECTDVVSYHIVEQMPREQAAIPIGKPIVNTQLYIINDDCHPVPHGVIGEIAVAGAGVGLGYLNKPELTQAVFVENPFGAGLLYKTGDLGRFLPDGAIEYVGRKDFQVKLRGLRIELGEVETAVKSLEGVTDALVLVEDQQLIAYGLVPQGDLDPNWQAQLRNQLPDYMVPSQLMTMEAWPLTPNGKIDRKALPRASEMGPAQEYVAPRNELESDIAEIWQLVLKQNTVGVHHSFFDLGGHSLLANQIVTRMRNRFSIELPIRDLILYPTVAQLAERVKLAQKSQQQGEMIACDRNQRIPLSAPQQRLWLLDKIEPGNPAYHVPSIIEVNGGLDFAVLEQAFQQLIQRHEVLRARFLEDKEGPYQVFSDYESATLIMADFSQLDEQQARKKVAGIVTKPFDLEQGGLVRGHICKLDEDRFVLIVVLHHIITDGWSNGLLIRQLAEGYIQILSGQQHSAPVADLQYADFACWQQQYLTQERLDTKFEFWQQQLQEVPVLDLPTDFSRPAVQSFAGASVSFQLSQTASAELDRLANRYQCTHFMVLLACYSVLLQRYSGQDHFAIGTPVAGRDRVELESMVGFFVNTVAIPVEPKPEQSFLQFLEAVKTTSLACFEHQDIPFEQIVEHINPDRDMSRSPLFQVMMAYQNLPQDDVGLGQAALEGLQFSAYELELETAKFDQTLTLWPQQGTIHGSLSYSTALFSADTMARFVQHFVALCESLLTHPQQALYQAQLLSPQERTRQVQEWNQTEQAYPPFARVEQWFSHAAQHHAIRSAICCDQQQLSYEQLEHYSNGLAALLVQGGVTPGQQVGLIQHRNLHLMTSILGILKAGGVYVPIDAAYPEQRIQYICEQSAIKFVLTQSQLKSLVPAGVEALEIDQLDLSSLASAVKPDLIPELISDPETEPNDSSDDLIYVIYTSGSTGLPKATAAYQRSEVNLLNWYSSQFGLNSDDRFLLLSAIGFDLTQKNLFAPLVNGAQLVIPSFQEYDPARLVDLIEQHQITWINCAPSAFYPLIDNPQDWPRLASLRHLFLGGEPINLARLADWLQQSQCQVVNSYGPTECTDIAAWHPVDLARDREQALLPIGKPNFNVQLYVLGEHLELLPQGAVGELCIAGDGVGPGYLNQAQLTQAAFVENPFTDNSKLYRTGDRARFRDDGSVVFLGRKDHQVKLRGYRIEVGEIEAVINQHPMVSGSLVAVLDRQNAPSQLVAWVESMSLEPNLLGEVQALCSTNLPKYMHPDAWVIVERFPLTPNGKVDRKNLPPPIWQTRSQSLVLPRTHNERLVADIWCQILKLDQVGVHDSFFELGGHSLLATQVAARIRSELGQTISIRDFMLAPTVEALAARLDKLGDQEAELELVAVPREQRLPLSFAQQRLWLLDAIEGGSLAYHVPTVLRIKGNLDEASLEHALAAVINRHEGLRTVINQDDSGPYQHILPQDSWTLATTQLIEDEQPEDEQQIEFEVKQQVMRQLMTPFDLETGPLFRAHLFCLPDNEYVFSMVIHHLVTDGWSMNLLLQDLVQAYLQHSSFGEANLSPLPIQYGDYAHWQRQRLTEEKQAQLLDYWSTQLHGVEPLALPTDLPRPRVQTFNGNTLRFTIDEATVTGLRNIATQQGCSFFTLLLSAYGVLLHKYSGQNDFAIGTPVAGREHTALEQVVGFFVNTLAVRLTLDPNDSFTCLLQQVKQTVVDGFAHQEVPFEQVVEAIDPLRDMSRSPLFQVMLAYQNLPVDQSQLGGVEAMGDITIEAFDPGVDSSKFEQTLTLWDQNGGLGGSLQYNTDLFTESTIAHFIEHFQALLKALVNDPDATLAQQSILTQQEVEQQVVEWNLTGTDHNLESTLNRQISAAANQYADNVAVVCGENQLTYQELEQVSNGLAHHLIEQGVAVGDRVAICSDRHVHLLTLCLGVIKAGATYVPIDPAYPLERICYILDAAEVKTVLTLDHLSACLPQNVKKISWQQLQSRIENYPADLPDISVSPQQLLYLIFTSGSTGLPKGTGAYHSSEINLLNWYCGQFNMTSQDKILLLSALGFDLTQKNLFAPLMTGATLVIPEFQEFDAQQINSLIQTEKVTWLNCAPSAFYALQDEPNQWPDISSLRLLFLGGEPINLQRLQAWLQQSHCQLINSYGPTECTDIAAWYAVDLARDIETATLPIGRPNYNVQLFILGEQLELLPVGAVGELCIAGAGVGPGYINNPELTATSFVDNPRLNSHGHSKLYRTGDRARYRHDGNVEYLGRRDHQIKLRGYRVEAGEIQAVLNRTDEVQDSLVDVLSDANGVQRLVAWVVSEQELHSSELANQCSQFLPRFMVPELWVVLAAFPLTPNGKVDRKALPKPQVEEADTYLAPRTDLENQLCDLWAASLGRNQVGIRNNFFEMGGQSLVATQLINKVSKLLGRPVPVRLLFENPTVEALAQALDTLSDHGQRPAIKVRQDRSQAPLSFGQQRLWFFEKMNPGTHANNMPVALKIKGELDTAVLEKAFQEVVRRHESLRTYFIEDAQGEPLQIIQQQIELTLDVEDIRALQGEQQQDAVARAIEHNSQNLIALDQAPLWNLRLLKLEQKSHLLLLCMHHIISDGASQVVLFRELMTLYLAYQQQLPSPLPELKVQYPDFAQWQRDWLNHERLEHQLAYWQKQLKSAPPLLELPLDYPRPSVQVTQGDSLSFDMPAGFVEQLKQVCNQQQVTPFMFMLLGWKLLLSRYSGQQDILVGVPTLGRDSSELDSVIGFFIQSLVLRSDLHRNPTVEQALSQIKTTVLDGFSNADVPVDLIAERLAVPRNPAYSPLVQVAFQLLDQAGFSVDSVLSNARFGDMEVEVVGGQTQSSKFDITLNLTLNESQLAGSLEFNSALFKRETIATMVAHYQTLCQALLTDLDKPLAAINFVGDSHILERLQLDSKDVHSVIPLSAMQYDMFMDNLVNPHSLQSSHGWQIAIHRPLDLELWQRCIQYLTDKQPLLRCKFMTSDTPYMDMGYLVVDQQKTVHLELFDYSEAAVDEEALNNHIRDYIYRPYQVTEDELIHHGVFKLAADHFIVVTAVHHGVLDGASLNNYWLQLIDTYQAFSEGSTPDISTVEFQNYVALDRATMDNQDILEFWRGKFASVEPLDFTVPSPIPEPGHFITREHFLEDEHWQKVKAYCRSQRITPALYFKCLYGILIGAYCRPDGDFSVQETMGGRTKGHAEGYGCYIQETPFVFTQQSLNSASKFGDLINYARSFQKEIKPYRAISIGKQIQISPRGRLGFMFNYYQFLASSEFLGQQFDPEGTPSDPTHNVQFVVTEVGGKLKLNLFYHGHLFADFGLLQRIQSLSQQIVEDGVNALSELRWVTNPTERTQLLELWNDTQRDYDLSLCIHQKFELQAAKTPDQLAIVDDENSLTYGQLNQKANQVAHHLVAKGIKSNDLVGLCAQRSCEFLVAVLGIMKAGGAYVPMDPKYPEDRILYMIENSQCGVLITEQVQLSKLEPHLAGVNTLCLDDDSSCLNQESSQNLNLPVSNRDRAYMIYTSGSTGLPKGAIVRHDGALNHIEAEREVLEFPGPFSFLQTAPSSSDISVWQFLGPVTCGGSVVVLDDVTHSQKLFNLVNQYQLDVVELVPVALQLLMEYVRTLPAAQRSMASLRWMMATGEAVSVDLVNQWLQLYPDIPVVNAYGPTEAADDVIQCAIPQPMASNQRSVPIGKPLPNLTVYVVDDAMRLVPAGVAGEICIGGIGVGEGYWRNPEKTAQAFVPNPFVPGDVLYRTGDLGRWLQDGTVEYLDRVDNQVKVRGFRIELGEVEAALSSLTGVRENVVIVRDDLPGGTALAAYVVAADSALELEASALRAQLREQVPDFMVPASITILSALPLTPAGKIDRKALPRPESLQLAGVDYVAPRNELEQQIASIWEAYMPVERISVKDNFFELGGHSLIGVRIIAKINKQLGTQLQVAALLSSQTIEGLAQLIQDGGSSDSELVPLQQNQHPPLFMIHPVGGDVLCYAELALALKNDFSVYGLRAQGLDGEQPPFDSLEQMVECYTQHIVHTQSQGPYRLLGQSLGGILALAVAERLVQLGHEVSAVMMLDTYSPDYLIQHYDNPTKVVSAAFGQGAQASDLQVSDLEVQDLQQQYQQLQRLRVVPQEVSLQQFTGIVKVSQQNQSFATQYKVENLATKVHHFTAQDNVTGVSSLESWNSESWKNEQDTSGQLAFSSCHRVPGGHETLMQGENAIPLAEQIAKLLANKNYNNE